MKLSGNKISGMVWVTVSYVFLAGVGIINGADNITHLIIAAVPFLALVFIFIQKENK